MPSKEKTGTWQARYSDGQSARSWQCELRLASRGLEIDRGDSEDVIIWPYSGLRSHTAIARGAGEVIVEWRDVPGAQLLIRDPAFLTGLVRLAPQLTTSATRRRWALPLLAIAAAICAAIALVWHLDLKPARAVAGLIPDGTRQKLGRTVLAQLTTTNKSCEAPAGKQALEALKNRLLQGIPGAAIYNVTVIDMPIINAFATPGGQMVITNRLIQAAKTPDEVAGVLAHEIGHGIEHHPEASLVRALGLSFLLELISGGSSGSLGGIGLMLVQTGYARKDEAAADAQALALLRRAAISQQGLADFFGRAARTRCKKTSAGDCKADDDKNDGGLNPFDLLRTHPYPKARLEAVRRSAKYPTTPAMTETEWQALRKICSTRR